MGENRMPVLCGGTFFTLILQAVKRFPKGRKQLESDVLAGLMEIIFSDFKILLGGNTFATLTSQYGSCSERLPKKSEYMPYTDTVINRAFHERVQNNYLIPLKAMEIFTNNFIDTNSSAGRDVWLAGALLELISLDKSITDKDMFFVCRDGQPISMTNMTSGLHDDKLPSLSVCLPALLLGIWHFITQHRTNNTIGQATYNSWHEEVKEESKGKTRTYNGEIGFNVKRKIEFIDVGISAKRQASAQNGMNESTHICPICQEEKPINGFGFRKTGDGEARHQSVCIDCRSLSKTVRG